MPELIISKDHQATFKVPLNPGVFLIGRAGDCDLVLNDPTISRKHAEIIWRDGAYWLKDCGSNLGTYLNSQKIEGEVPLIDRTEFIISSFHLKFMLTPMMEEDDDTQITPFESDVETKVLKMDASGETATIAKTFLMIEGRNEPSRKIPFKGDVIIGSSDQADIRVSDDYVSSKHCRILKKGDEIVLKDLKSTNGTFVMGLKVTESVILPGTSIKIGQTSIVIDTQESLTKITPLPVNKLGGLVGQHPETRAMFARISLVAPSDISVLIQGETGTGKELVAHAIHDLSARKSGPYVVVNCGAISPQLIESELFGHEKGSFTGAINRHIGAFEQANGGTLFLDEIGELPLSLQPKFLRALENRVIKRVGGDCEIPVNVRVVAATNRNLAQEVKKGKFREDLFFRLYVVPLQIIPLRQRKEDIPLLVDHFLKQSGFKDKTVSNEAIQKMLQHTWAGNIRELRNVLLRSLVFCQGSVIKAEHVEFMPAEEKTDQLEGNFNLAEIEKSKILEALDRTEGNKAKAADLLGIAKSTLFNKLKEYNIG